MIARRINQRKEDTPILVQRWVVKETWVGVHANLVVPQVYKSLDSSELDRLRWRRSETTLSRTSVSAGRGTVVSSDLSIILIQ